MLHMLLVILKIIGILLLVLLGLILFAALSILFVPLRYRVWVKYDQQLQASLRLSWFLRLISLRVTFDTAQNDGDGNMQYSARILGYRFADSRKAKAQTGNKDEDHGTPKDPLPQKQEQVYETKQTEHNKTIETLDQEKPEQEEEKQQASDGLKMNLFEKLKSKFKRATDLKHRISQKVQRLRHKKDAIMNILTDPNNQPVFLKLKNSVKKLLLYLLPTHFELTLHFGFEDPASTGTCLGLLSLLYPLYTDHICLYPDFEHQIFKGETFIKGRIRSFIFVKTFLTLALDKGVRRVLQSFKRI